MIFAGEHFVQVEPRECGRLQLCASVRVLPAPEPYLFGVRNAGAELVRLSQAEQVLAVATQVHPTHSPTSVDSFAKAEAVGTDPC